MTTVSGNEFIIRVGSGHTTCCHSFLPNVQVAKAPDLLHPIQLTGFFFEPAQ
jgi:hypothetical protein